jgi:mono/diheme cytochrome c family protein
MRKAAVALITALWAIVFIAVVSAAGHRQSSGAKGWRLPPNAAEEKNPLPVNDAMMAAGKAQFLKRCIRCHGTEGKGDGPEADQDHVADMDLTRADRAARNPDGVVFYKVWGGRSEPKMPAFEDQMTKEQVWAVVAYVQTLRQKK